MRKQQLTCTGTHKLIFRPPEMCDFYSKLPVNEKVDIWCLGCVLYSLMFKKHPFLDAQKVAIINAHYYVPETNYSEKLLDFMRLMLNPNPQNRPPATKIIQAIQNWDKIGKIELPVKI
jgi:serine/threonine protein kinase